MLSSLLEGHWFSTADEFSSAYLYHFNNISTDLAFKDLSFV